MKQDVICWDSSVLISWIRGDEIADKRRAIETVVNSIEKGTYKLAVSTLIYVEVLECTMPEGAIEQFKKFMQNRQTLEIVAVDIRVAEKAQTIRNKSSKAIHTPDAIHVATAIVCGAKLFHTFDEKLLRLNGKDEVENLMITPCDVPGKSPSLF